MWGMDFWEFLEFFVWNFRIIFIYLVRVKEIEEVGSLYLLLVMSSYVSLCILVIESWFDHSFKTLLYALPVCHHYIPGFIPVVHPAIKPQISPINPDPKFLINNSKIFQSSLNNFPHSSSNILILWCNFC